MNFTLPTPLADRERTRPRPLHRRLSTLSLAFAVAAISSPGVCAEPGKVQSGERPNVVLIMADDLGYGDIGCYDGWIKTPNLDRLAASGLRLTDYHSNGAVCSPTRAALLTGRYQQRTGVSMVVSVKLRHLGLQPREQTVAESFHAAGYATAVFGKWHLGYETRYNPIHQGFDRFQGYVSGNVDFFSHVDQAGVYDWWRQDKLFEEPGYTTHLITRHAVQFIDENRDRPFFLYLPHEAPHYPYQGPHDKAERVVGGTFPSHGSRADPREAYREMVAEMDSGVGQVLDRLESLGLRERTIVVFCSDNGATRLGSNGALRGAKGSVWEGGHRVPAMISWKGRIASGVSDASTMSMDWMPTLLRLAGLAPPADHLLDGIDLTPLLLQRVAPSPRPLFWQHQRQLAMRQGVWKLVSPGGNNRSALFRLDEDLGEQRDLAARESERLQAMQAALAVWQEDVARGATAQPSAPR